MSEIAKRLERAEKHLQKGKLPAALDEFRAVLSEDPSNDFARQRAADLCLSLDLMSEAAGYFGETFDHCLLHGRTPEAINTYKKLVRLGPVDTARTFKYAQLIEKSSPREALEAFKSAFQAFVADGDKELAHTALKHMLSLEPSTENFHRDAELAVSMGDNRGAAFSFLKIGQMEENSARDGASYFERAYSLDPSNPVAALSHARCLMRSSRAEQAVEVLQTLNLSTPDFLETYANALLLANQVEAAESVVMKFYEQTPAALPLIGEVLTAYVRDGHNVQATNFAHSSEPRIRQRGHLKEFLTMIRDLVEKHNAGIEFLEYLAQLYNAANREHEYCDTLLRLFEIYFAQRNYMKAAECLDRASEVDAYEPGHQERLEMLRGKIDANRFNSIANRITTVARTSSIADDAPLEEEPVQSEDENSQEPTVLEDLMLQAEIFLQYSMRSKAVERLERISKLFPREEEKREKLAQIFAAAGFESCRFRRRCCRKCRRQFCASHRDHAEHLAPVEYQGRALHDRQRRRPSLERLPLCRRTVRSRQATIGGDGVLLARRFEI
jgi:tetratricopeptide (TPR) repeat protein